MFGLLNSSIIKELPPLLRDPRLRFSPSSFLLTLTIVLKRELTLIWFPVLQITKGAPLHASRAEPCHGLCDLAHVSCARIQIASRISQLQPLASD